MMKRFPSIAVLVACVALAACGGGGVHSSGAVPGAGGASGLNQLLTGQHNAAPAAGAVQAQVSVFVPFARQTAATRRRPKYITSYTAGLEIEAVQNGVSSGFQSVVLGANAPGCSVAGNNAGFTCAITLAAPVGQTEIVVGTYDGSNPPPGSNLLSVADQIVTIQSGVANVIPITTLPIAANVQPAVQPPGCVVVGTPVNISTTYTAYDADGGDLTGLTLGNTLTLTNVNPVDMPSGYGITPSTFTSGSGPLTFTYNGTDTNVSIFNITSSLAPDGGNNEYVGIVGTVPAATAGPHMVYVSDAANNEILGYDICARSSQVAIYNLPNGFNPVEVKFDRSSSAADPRLFVLSQALNQLIWLDVQTAPGTIKQTLTFGGTPHHVNDSSTSAFLWVTIGANTFKKFAINEGAATVTAVASPPPITTLNQPRGFGFGGAGNDILVANTGAGTIQAVNPSTMVTDGSVAITGSPSKLSGPNVNATCELATSSSPANSAFAVSIVAAGGTPAQIGAQLSLPGPPVAQQFFPPATPGSGTVGFGTTTGIIATTNGGAQIVLCDGSTFTPVTIWNTFMAQPAAMVSSQYASLAVGGLIYVTGLDQGSPVIQPFAANYDHDLGAIQLPGGTNPTDITAGP
jgi:hypothetical protein